MKYLPIIITLGGLWSCQFQDTPHLVDSRKKDANLVDSLNEHFYETYSADFAQARTAMESAINLSKENKWPKKLANAYKNMAVLEYLTGNYEQALHMALQSHDLFDSLQDWSGVAQTNNELGNFYRKTGQYEQALAMWDEAEELAKRANDLTTLGTTYGMKGTFYWLQKQYDISDNYYFKCYDIRLKEQDSVGLGYVLIDLADMEQRKGNLNAAIDYFEQSNSIRKRIGDWQGLVENYKTMGDLWITENQWETAREYYKQCEENCQQMGYPDLRRKSLDSLSSVFRHLRQFEKALQFKILANNLKDSLFSAEKSRSIQELQTKYETAKNKQLIAEQQLQLQQKNVLLGGFGIGIVFLGAIGFQTVQRQNMKHRSALEKEKRIAREGQIEAAINSQEKERSRFAKDLHDGFGQMISILNLNLKSLEAGEKDKHAVFENSSKVLEEMYQELKGICFNLMPQTLIKYGISSAISEFATRINQTGQIFIETDFFGLKDRLIEVQEISLYRIAQEWVNNIIKYSDATKITVQITQDETELTLLI